MGLDFDVLEFCRKLRTSKQPPYECPLPECGRVYKSLCGLQYHLVNFDHNASSPQTSIPTGRKKSRGSHITRTPTATSDLLTTPTREGLTYAEAQKMVEFEVDGKISRVSIHEPLPILSKEEYEETFGNNEDMCGTHGTNDGRTSAAEEKVKLPEPCFTVLDNYNISDAPPRPNSYIRFIERSAEEMDAEVEYDMDEEDCAWLSIINERRAAAGLTDVPVDTFELLMDRLEKESYFQSNGKTGEGAPPVVIDDDAVCCICMDGECQNSNVILFCDMCNLAVHQDCYGVPYIPEGQWLCRRCLQSPSRAVDCVLCPNNGGAFKQTDRGHWAHVVCALWIPEVRFANTVFLEPIDSIETIPPARWKLTCYICKQRGVGACIQCHKTNCYAAFHVTCAQQAGLFMKMDTVRDSNTGAIEPGPVLVQKTAYCDAHTPAEAERPRSQAASSTPQSTNGGGSGGASGGGGTGGGGDDDENQKMKKARRMLAKKRSSVPVISIPTIPPERIQEIASLVNIPKKNQLIQRLIAYWTLKRQYRNGVPLLRRLQSSHLARRDDPRPLQEVVSDAGELYRQLKFWQCLRQDLERARLLCELVRKREKLKKELCKLREHCLRMELCPRECFMIGLIDLLQTKDTGEIFSEPVDQTEVVDYSDVVKQPMDLSTMRVKAANFEYQDLDSLEADFLLMINNCMAYNARDTVFYRAALRMREQGGALIRQARYDMEVLKFDPVTGLLIPPDESPVKTQHAESDIDRELADITSKVEVGGREALARLLELQVRCQDLKLGPARAKRLRLIRSAITKLRRRINASAVTARSEGEDGFESDSEHEDTTEEEVEDVAKKNKETNPSQVRPQPIQQTRPSTRRSISQQSGSHQAAEQAPAPTPAARPSASTASTPAASTTPVLSTSNAQTGDAESSDEPIQPAVSLPQPARRGRRRRRPGRRPNRERHAGLEGNFRPQEGGSSGGVAAGATTATTAKAASQTQQQAQSVVTDTQPVKDTSNNTPPVTPVKMSTSDQSQMSASPSGVNRRTAVLFTRKAAAAAFRKPDPPGGSISMSGSDSSNTPAPVPAKRRVGRPRKHALPGTSGGPSGSNSAPAVMTPASTSSSIGSQQQQNNQQPSSSNRSDIASSVSGLLLGVGAASSTSDAPLLPATPLPATESFRVYRSGGDIPPETDDETQSESSCWSCTSSDDEDDDDDEDAEGNSSSGGGGGGGAGGGSGGGVSGGSAGGVGSRGGGGSGGPSAVGGNSGIGASGGAMRAAYSSGADDDAGDNSTGSSFEPLDLVWAKCRGYPWYPALIINPKMPRTGYLHNGVPIPAPPLDVLALASNYEEPVYLVLFFDTKRTWQWLPRNKLEPLGLTLEMDQAKLTESRKPADRKAVRKAYDDATLHRRQVASGLGPNEEGVFMREN
ncbi:peregrin isoform X1 [Schistocerca serialis cubense]|uniref:peregrin isoform X1 n=1 Tax=Schistocerca serialis cubense TaxID=2023355 RepID=UPI00214F1041|nr:peregrin isoform X1 [Schistocerca serialis cubense]